MPPDVVRMVPEGGGAAVDVPVAEVQIWTDRGYSVQGNAERATQVADTAREEYYSSPEMKLRAGITGLARGAFGGLTDAAAVAIGGDEVRRELEAYKQYNPITSTGTEIVGSLAPIGWGGTAARAGRAISRVGEGAGAIAKIARAGGGMAAEGALLGAGTGVSQLALSKDPVTMERIASTMTSNILLGGGTGAVIGGAGRAIGLGLERAKGALERYASKGDDAANALADVAHLDAKGLRAAEKLELESIESARVARRSEIADEVRALRQEMKDSKVWLATKDADVKAIKEVREIGKTSLEADKAIDRMLRNPKALAKKPERVLDGLQQQEHALEQLIAQGDNLRPIFAKDASGTRAAALDYAATALEKNRALQAKIGEVTGKPTSARLTAIADAKDIAASAGGKDSLQQMLMGAAAGTAIGYATDIPYVGPIAGAVLARGGIGSLMRKIGVTEAKAAKRASQAIDVFLSAGRKAAPYAPVVATKVLGAVAYAQQAKRKDAGPAKLPDLYRERVAEVRSHVIPGPDGKLMMRPESRERIAAQLAPVRAADPLLADHIETVAARKTTFLADKAPRKPDPFGLQLGGPDRWQPSDMQMRQWARYVSAVEDPQGVIERLADGTVTPEDAETMREVYPEIYADVQRQITERLGELKTGLPYQKRLALSVFSGVAVDPVLDPRVLAALQASFQNEAGTEGGTQAPAPSPQFGSVSKPKGTPTQERAE